jgi:uncharacterized caspase-like protein
MRRLSLLFAFLVVGLTTPAIADKRVALVIGNSAYEHVARLGTPADDASAIAALFKGAGFQVFERTDLANLGFRRVVREFTVATRDADIAVVFFAGHGVEIRGTNYLIPVDAALKSDLDATDEAISLDRILESVESAKRLRLIILDACRENPFEKRMKRNFNTRAVARGLAEISAPANTVVAFAAKAGSTCEDGSGKNSTYTMALLKHLATPGLDVRLALGRVRDEVLRATDSRQEPYAYGSLGGSELALVSRAVQSVTPAPPKASQDVRADYELGLAVGTREAWEAFLSVHPNGFYANLARGQLAKLNNAEPTAPPAVHIPSPRQNIVTDPVAEPRPAQAPPSHNPIASRRLALIFGNDSYETLPPLQKAVNDARAVGTTLARLGFDVTRVENASRRMMNQKIAEFASKVQPGDTALFFYAGHGVEIRGTNYLLATDTPPAREGQEGLIASEGIPTDVIIERLQESGARISLLILDACRENPFKRPGTRGVGTSRGLGRMNAPRGVFVLYSAGLGEAALDRLSDADQDPNSIFTRAFVPALSRPGISVQELAKVTQEQVNRIAATVNHPQMPAYYDQILGQFTLVPAP